MEYEPSIIPPTNLYESVLLRPAIYTMTGAFEECISFLNGHFGGVAKCNPMAPDVIEWGLFREWLTDELNAGDSNVFQVLRQRSASSEDALRQLAILAGRFRAIK